MACFEAGLSRINVAKDDTTRPAPEQAKPSLPKPATSQEPSSVRPWNIYFASRLLLSPCQDWELYQEHLSWALQIPSSGSATRKAVVQACLQTSLFMSLAGLCLRAAASWGFEELRLADSSAALRLLSSMSFDKASICIACHRSSCVHSKLSLFISKAAYLPCTESIYSSNACLIVKITKPSA